VCHFPCVHAPFQPVTPDRYRIVLDVRSGFQQKEA
jgi:hypothetical protein